VSEWAAVELDPLSARITKMLYPGARVFAEGFESATYRRTGSIS
jgi:hypothetical protein